MATVEPAPVVAQALPVSNGRTMTDDYTLTVTEAITKGHNGLPFDLNVGDTVYRFKLTTYGACTPWEVAISVKGPRDYPFHGVPRSSVTDRYPSVTDEP
jgi:hypothetical protein